MLNLQPTDTIRCTLGSSVTVDAVADYEDEGHHVTRSPTVAASSPR
jgi:hypothetical protein